MPPLAELSLLSDPRHVLTDGRRLLSAGNDAAPAVIGDDGRSASYGELRREAGRLGETFGPGKKLILIVAGNDVDTVTTYVAALNAGQAVVLVAPEPAGLIDHVCEHYDPNFICRRTGAGWRIEERHARELPLHPELACMLSTSGTTGEGKFVRLSYRNLLSNALSIVEYLGIRNDDRFLLNLPINYSYGLSILNSHLVAGACVLASDRSVTEPALWDFFRSHRGSGFPGVPHTYKLLEASKFENLDLPDLRTMTQAGGRLPEPLARKFAKWAGERGVRFFIMYGQTEASPRIAYLPPELAETHPDCIGRPIPGGTIELVGPDGTPVEGVGEIGELQYSGPNVMMGYATQLSDLALPPGPPVLRTGDLAMRTAEGLFKIVGREKRFLKIYGLRISLDEIERRLEAESVRALCAGNDEFLGVMTTASDGTDQELVERISRISGLPPAVIVLLRVSEFPLLPTGKIDYRRAGQMLLEVHTARARRQPTDRTAGAAVETAMTSISRIYSEAFPGKAIRPEDSFVSLGGDSLTYVSVAVSLEELLGSLPDNWEKVSVAELEALALAPPARSAARKSRELETSIFLRAIAAVIVVINHALGGGLEGGASLLLAVVGMNFARFQQVQLVAGREREVIQNFLVNVLVPYYLVLFGFAAVTGHIRLSDVLLVASFDMQPPAIRIPFGTWFIQVVAQILLLMILAFRFGPVRRLAEIRPFRFGLYCFLFFGLSARLFESIHWHFTGSSLGGGLTSEAWIFALGMMIAAAETPSEGLLLSVFALTLPWVFHKGEISRPAILAMGCLLAIWVPRITLPTRVASVIGILASASMFIYMLHQLLLINEATSPWPPLVHVIAGVMLGVTGWWAFSKMKDKAYVRLKRP